MRLALFLGLAALLLALVWLARPSARGQGTRSAARASEAELAEASELLAPAVPAAGEAAGDADGERARSTRARSSAPRASGTAAVAPVRGRMVVAETGDPIEAVLDLRLRTNDLLRKEDLRTRPDGSFEGRTLFPRSVLLALVKDEEGRELVDQEAPFDPRSEEPWLVRVPESAWPTFARGTVVDRRGAPIDLATVRLVPLVAGGLLGEETTDGDGSFHLEPLRPGRHRLQVQGRWARAEPVEVVLRSGPNELGLLVVPEPAPGGDLVLTIASDAPGAPACEFELVESGGGLRQRFDTSLGYTAEGGELWLELAGLPAGSYALSVRALDGRRYEPDSLRFSPPAKLALQARGEGLPGTTFRARDALTGAALTGFTVFGRKGRTWRHQAAYGVIQGTGPGSRSQTVRVSEARLPPGFDAWVVSAAGFRAAFGTFAGAGDTLEVALEAGWSELYQFEDATDDASAPLELQRFLEPAVLEGVAVLADGTLAGTSDAHGFFALSADKEPDRIEFQKPGWFPVREHTLGILRTVELVPGP